MNLCHPCRNKAQIIMKFYATTAALVGAVMACILVTVAAADRMTVTATDESSSWKFGEIVLNLDYYDDGRNQPYVIVLSKDDIDSSWNFRADFSIKRFQIDSDKYRVSDKRINLFACLKGYFCRILTPSPPSVVIDLQ